MSETECANEGLRAGEGETEMQEQIPEPENEVVITPELEEVAENTRDKIIVLDSGYRVESGFVFESDLEKIRVKQNEGARINGVVLVMGGVYLEMDKNGDPSDGVLVTLSSETVSDLRKLCARGYLQFSVEIKKTTDGVCLCFEMRKLIMKDAGVNWGRLIN